MRVITTETEYDDKGRVIRTTVVQAEVKYGTTVEETTAAAALLRNPGTTLQTAQAGRHIETK